MKSKIVLTILALIIIGVGGYYFYDLKQRQAQAPTGQIQTNTNQESQTPAVNAPESQSPASASSSPSAPSNNSQLPPKTFSTGAEADLGVDVQVSEIDFNGTSFSPSSVNIKVGDYVIFKNNSQTGVWPASNPHPVHTDYPGFDAKAPIAPGGKYQFQFTKVGSWGFHDHLSPSIKGVVNVNP